MKIDDSFYISLAINAAWKYQLLTYPNPAVGAVVLKSGKLLSVEAHKEAGKPHAEVLALKEAFLKENPNSKLKDLTESSKIHSFLIDNHNNFFEDCELFVTLEPCNHIGKTPACSNLIKEVKPKRVIISTLDPNNEASGGKESLEEAGIDVIVGIEEKKAQDLLYPFYCWNRGYGFKFFKMAQRLDGSINGGYITSKNSLKLVHKLRAKLDYLAIGGKTVREDRPTLDCRLINEKAPNVKIFSRQSTFDKNIPLFNINSREIKIENNLENLKSNGLVMIEGGYSFLEATYKYIDMLLLFVSAKTLSSKNSTIETNYKILHTIQIDDQDFLLFLKKI
jgi:diaminohydroxyphosphoribosylaminopyrimidine deaminase/5-amino-6-(5-phosphoribosylamino)uracil reductase